VSILFDSLKRQIHYKLEVPLDDNQCHDRILALSNLFAIASFCKKYDVTTIARTVLEREKKSYSSDKVQVMNQNTK